jgi:large subunit ribosomal protein L28
MSAHRVSHSNLKTKRRQLPNLRKMRIKISGKIKTVNVCTRCARTLLKKVA